MSDYVEDQWVRDLRELSPEQIADKLAEEVSQFTELKAELAAAEQNERETSIANTAARNHLTSVENSIASKKTRIAILMDR